MIGAKALDAIAALEFKTLIPGHGRTGPKDQLLAENRGDSCRISLAAARPWIIAPIWL